MNFDIVMHAVNGYFAPERLLMNINTRTREIPNNIEPAVNIDLVRFHERIHYFQTGMTGCGQLRWNMYRQLTITVIEDWLDITEKYKACRPLPLGYLCKKSREDLIGALKIKMQSDFRKASLLQMFAGDSKSTADDFGLFFFKGDYDLTPCIRINGEDYYINGNDVFECHAKILEALYAFEEYGIDFDKIVDREVLLPKYYCLWDWFSDLHGEGAILDFLTICDLSLQSVKWNSLESNDAWSKHHPGWRFYNLTNKLADSDISLFSSKEDMKSRYDEYCEKLLRKCDYESMNEVFEDCLAMYNYNSDYPNLLGLENRMKSMIEYRKEHSWIGANPLLDPLIWNHINKEFFPVLIQDSGAVNIVPYSKDYVPSEPPSWDGIFAEVEMEIHTHALVEQVLGHTSEYSTDIDEIQCGYSYFGLREGCPFQSRRLCTGSFPPKEGSPVPFIFVNKEDVVGCRFEVYMDICGIGEPRNLDLNNRFREFPSYEEIANLAKQG